MLDSRQDSSLRCLQVGAAIPVTTKECSLTKMVSEKAQKEGYVIVSVGLGMQERIMQRDRGKVMLGPVITLIPNIYCNEVPGFWNP